MTSPGTLTRYHYFQRNPPVRRNPYIYPITLILGNLYYSLPPKPPMSSSDFKYKYSAEDSALIADLIKLSNKSPKLVKSTEHATPADPNINLRSWKMNEHKYYDIPTPFPTLARGLFSMELPKEAEDEDEKRYRIVVRGYDKFFNIGEVPWTHVRVRGSLAT